MRRTEADKQLQGDSTRETLCPFVTMLNQIACACELLFVLGLGVPVTVTFIKDRNATRSRNLLGALNTSRTSLSFPSQPTEFNDGAQ